MFAKNGSPSSNCPPGNVQESLNRVFPAVVLVAAGIFAMSLVSSDTSASREPVTPDGSFYNIFGTVQRRRFLEAGESATIE